MRVTAFQTKQWTKECPSVLDACSYTYGPLFEKEEGEQVRENLDDFHGLLIVVVDETRLLVISNGIILKNYTSGMLDRNCQHFEVLREGFGTGMFAQQHEDAVEMISHYTYWTKGDPDDFCIACRGERRAATTSVDCLVHILVAWVFSWFVFKLVA